MRPPAVVWNHPETLTAVWFSLCLVSFFTSLQVIGLTASPGVGRGDTLENAVTYVRDLCFSMDVEKIGTVKINVDDLNRFINEPKHGGLNIPLSPRFCSFLFLRCCFFVVVVFVLLFSLGHTSRGHSVR